MRKGKAAVVLILICITFTVQVPVYAKPDYSSTNIAVSRISSHIMLFEETISLNLPEYGMPEGSYYRVNVYGVKVGRGVILIDSGDDTLSEELYQTVIRAFRKPIQAVYLTHYHADHAGGGSYFQSLGIPIYAPITETPFIQAGANLQPGTPDEFTYEGYTPDCFYEIDELLRGFSVIPAPGHTVGAVSIQYSKGRHHYLFTADTIMPMMSDDIDPLDFTFELNFNTARQNYEYSDPAVFDFWMNQLNTLYGMLEIVYDYDLILTGHAPVLNAEEAYNYILYTIGTLESIPYL